MGKTTVDIENLREIVLLSEDKVWGITSLSKKTGKTFVARKLVESLSKAGKKVVYLSFKKESGEETKNFLEKELKNAESVSGLVKSVVLKDMFHLEEIVYSEKFTQLVKEYQEDYDYIIMDMMSMEENSIAKRIASVCENNFIVVEKDCEDGAEVGKMVHQLKALNIRLAGVVLNEYHEKKKWLRM
ncbi:hypothetical protein JCM31739_05590 [Faecalimonas canis]